MCVIHKTSSVLIAEQVIEIVQTSRKKAIIVDDDQAFIDSLADLVNIAGIDVIGTGKNGKDAVTMYETLRPDIVMLDLMMDDYDGFYAIKGIQKIDPDARFIVMSALDSKKAYEDLIKLGVQKIIRKPVTADKIGDVLANHDQHK